MKRGSGCCAVDIYRSLDHLLPNKTAGEVGRSFPHNSCVSSQMKLKIGKIPYGRCSPQIHEKKPDDDMTPATNFPNVHRIKIKFGLWVDSGALISHFISKIR